MALGTLRRLTAQQNGFELVAASAAAVLENWHDPLPWQDALSPNAIEGQRRPEDDKNIIDV